MISKVIGKVTSNVTTVESLGSKLLINEPIVYSGQPVVIDVETDEKDNFVGGAITIDGSYVYYYSDWGLLEPIASQAQLIGHNLKGDCHWLKKWGARITPNSLLADTMLMSYVSYATRESHGLKPLCKELLDIEWPSYKEMTGKGRGKKTLDMLPVEEVAEYCGMDCLGTFKLYEYFNKRMLPQQKTIYEQLEMPLSRLLWKMEDKGVKVDCSLLSKMDNHMEDEVMRIKEGIKQLTGKDFNPNSPKQKILLLNELGFKTKTSDKKFLIKHKDHPLIKLLLENSEMGKIHSSFIQAFLKIKTLPIIHTSFNQVSESKIDEDDAHGIATGRLCVHPETLIEMPRDLVKFPGGVPLKDVKINDYIYSLTWDKRLCLKQVKWVGPTKEKETIKVTVKSRWGKITSFMCSEDHLVRLFRGEWKPAGSLKVGVRLCGFVQRGIDEYARFFPSSLRRKRGESGGKAKEHRWVYGQVRGKMPATYMDIHHKDGNKLNNHPSNLELLSYPEHRRLHFMIKQDEVERAIKDPSTWKRHPKTLKRCIKRYGLCATNHTIIAIEHIGKQQLWDLEVEDTHTFFGGEVALHNSSKSPNLQQIPSRSENGKEIRKLFVPRNPEELLVVADYSQIELRVAAHFSHDPILTTAFKSGEDVHEATAKALGVDRFYGKTGNFLLAFGGGPAKLMSALNIPEHKAIEFYNLYWARFHVLKQWKENVVSNARRLGGVQTIHGFWLSLPNLDYDKAYASASAMLDNVNAKRKAKEERLLSQHQLAKYIIGKAERMAVSGIVQGSAAYMIKKAMLKCNEIGYTPILTVHDELVFESTTRGVAEAETNIKQIMENIVKLDVPLEVVIGHGANWGEAKC